MGTIIEIEIASTLTKITGTELAMATLLIASLTKVGTNLIVVKLTTYLGAVGTTITFLFKERNITSYLRLNYKMSLVSVRTSSIGITDMVEELAMALNKSKLESKQMIKLLVRCI